MPENHSEISRDALAIAQSLVDLTREMTTNNNNFSKLDKLLYGDEQGKGGLVVRMASTEAETTRHTALLQVLETSCGAVVQSLDTQLAITKQQGESINRLYKMVFILMGTVIFIMLSLGLVGWKEIAALISGLP